MPKPPLLAPVDWKLIISKGKSFSDWISAAENSDAAAKMRDDFESFPIDNEVSEWLAAIPKKINVVLIAEDWCGDVWRHVPVLEKIAAQAGNIDTYYISREDMGEDLARFLTNGGEAIPKIIFLNNLFIETGNWGPMPEDCREIISRGKACGDIGAARKLVSERYQQDSKREAVVSELLQQIDIASSIAP